ncbi:pyruvate dehydrogenase phosphatase regulatory subunit, mitochondrial-like, partial [Limulus polyphemus]|uniref:Pyruvate dehydrogenase phosphatase regulatory subunit, mitochondrial-like n=1 Tax=Limulus polyphemus TaxID=6850 RepID=A0ABM1C254_LIMPO
GGVWVATDGIVNPLAVCTTLARLAQSQGAQYIENCQVHKILTENGRVVGAKTSNGPIKCEIFVLAAGMWSRELANTCVPRFRLPIHPAEHQYAVTEVKPALTESLPIVRDYDGQIYCREHQGGLLFGGFEKEGKPLFHKGVPPKFEFQKLPADVVHFQPLCDQAKYRLPILETAHIKEIVNGPETFTPDGKFILGETPEVEGLYVVVGMNGNTVQAAGGVGRALADWITNAEPEAQLLPFDVRRFIDLHNNQKFLRERMREAVGQHYALAHPLPIEFHSARKLRCSPLYTLQEAAGAVFGERMGFERALYFAPEKP